MFPQGAGELLTISVSQGMHHPDDGRIRLRSGGVTRQRVGPFSPLIDPCLDDADLLRRQWSLRRHLWARCRPDQPPIDGARGTVTRDNTGAVGTDSVRHGVATAIQPESAHLLRRTVALDAVLPEDRLNLASEVDFGGRLCGERRHKQKCPDDYARRSRQHISSILTPRDHVAAHATIAEGVSGIASRIIPFHRVSGITSSTKQMPLPS